MTVLSPGAMLAIAMGVVVLGSDVWVYGDARSRLRRGERVSVAVGALRVETPEAWLLGCTLLFIVFLPLYLTASGRNPFASRS